MLWSLIFQHNIEISFAHTSFKWSNNAKNKAGVSCVIIGLYKKRLENKYIYSDNNKKAVRAINPYLSEGENCIVMGSFKPLQGFPVMEIKNMTYDGGNLIFNEEEKKIILQKEPEVSKYIVKLQSGSDFIDNIYRYSFWIEEKDLNDALQFNSIKERIDKVKNFRQNSGSVAKSLVDKSYCFRFPKRAKNHMVIIPRTTGENREYLPVGLLDNNTITTDAAYGIYDYSNWILGIIMSKMQIVWMKPLCGRLGTSFRYSSSICYNSFPFPTISEEKKKQIIDGDNGLWLCANHDKLFEYGFIYFDNQKMVISNRLNTEQQEFVKKITTKLSVPKTVEFIVSENDVPYGTPSFNIVDADFNDNMKHYLELHKTRAEHMGK